MWGDDKMSMTMHVFFLVFLVGVILYFLGRHLEDYMSGILGGLVIFVLGVATLIDPLDNVSSLLNLMLGSVTFGFGAYVWIVGGLEWMRSLERG